jgi:SPP1 family predicted phage head-tail adaptor
MNFGKLDRLITLQKPAPAPANSFGGAGQQSTFTDVAQVYAQVDSVPGSEGFVGDQLTATQRQKITIRYRADVAPDWQLVIDGRTYQITDLQQFGRRVGLLLFVYSRG